MALKYLIEYIRDDVCKASLGGAGALFPFLITMFMFILINNIIGLIPGCTPRHQYYWCYALGLCSLGYFMYVGAKMVLMWLHPGAPKGVDPVIAAVIWVIEVFSTFLRLVTLAVRLFCNMWVASLWAAVAL